MVEIDNGWHTLYITYTHTHFHFNVYTIYTMYKFMNPYHSSAGSTTLFLAQLPGLICGSLKDEHEAVDALHQEIQVCSLSSLFDIFLEYVFFGSQLSIGDVIV